MASPKKIVKVKLFFAVMYSDASYFEELLKILKSKFGPVDVISDEFHFVHTDYYEEEFGRNLRKRFFSFKKLIDRIELSKIKHYSNELESRFSKNGKRLINIDPGYVTSHNVVVASYKEMPYRLFVGDCVFGDVQLIFKKGCFVSNDHTFPDFKEKLATDFFLNVRL